LLIFIIVVIFFFCKYKDSKNIYYKGEKKVLKIRLCDSKLLNYVRAEYYYQFLEDYKELETYTEKPKTCLVMNNSTNTSGSSSSNNSSDQASGSSSSNNSSNQPLVSNN